MLWESLIFALPIFYTGLLAEYVDNYRSFKQVEAFTPSDLLGTGSKIIKTKMKLSYGFYFLITTALMVIFTFIGVLFPMSFNNILVLVFYILSILIGKWIGNIIGNNYEDNKTALAKRASQGQEAQNLMSPDNTDWFNERISQLTNKGDDDDK